MARRTINAEGRQKIKEWEAKGGIPNLTAYRDTGGVWTIGYGHTGPDVRAGLTITPERAEQLLSADLADAENAVAANVKVPLTDNQFAALVSFTFNVGTAAFRKSTLLKKLNAGDYGAVPKELVKWNHDNGKVVAGLTNRRAAELGLWAKGEYVASAYKDVQPRPVKSGIKITAVAQAVAGVSAGAAAMADKLQPVASSTSWTLNLFLGLTLVGIIGGGIGAYRAYVSDKATA